MVRAMTKSNEQQPKQRANFADTENKSLEPEVTETKEGETTAAAVERVRQQAPAERSDTVKVKMLHHGQYDGKSLIPGVTYELPKIVAGPLVVARRATFAE